MGVGGVLDDGDEIGEVLRGQSFLQTFRHQGDPGSVEGLDALAVEGTRGTIRKSKEEGGAGVTGNQAIEFLPIVEGHLIGFETGQDDGVGIEDGLEEALVGIAGDCEKVGAHFASFIAESMTGGAEAGVQFMAAEAGAFQVQGGAELFQDRGSGGGIRLGEEGFGAMANSWGRVPQQAGATVGIEDVAGQATVLDAGEEGQRPGFATGEFVEGKVTRLRRQRGPGLEEEVGDGGVGGTGEGAEGCLLEGGTGARFEPLTGEAGDVGLGIGMAGEEGKGGDANGFRCRGVFGDKPGSGEVWLKGLDGRAEIVGVGCE
jgi:hypothetical protein